MVCVSTVNGFIRGRRPGTGAGGRRTHCVSGAAHRQTRRRTDRPTLTASPRPRAGALLNMGRGPGVYLCVTLLLGQVTLPFSTCTDTGNSGNGIFKIRHESSGKCLQAENSQLSVTDCKDSLSVQWKWGSGHRLFHVGSAQCLGLDITTKAVGLFECNNNKKELWWRCDGGSIFSAYKRNLAVVNDTVTTKSELTDTWLRDLSSESICEQPYHVVHTTRGNSFGLPCEFPFLFNGSWHHDCISDGRADGMEWCSTTPDYDTNNQWGLCLKPEIECGALWDLKTEDHCYQFNFQSTLSWKKARVACLSQGGDLLSVSSLPEVQKLLGKGGYPDYIWIGLNHLDLSQGWQWSDGSPLAFVNWGKGMLTQSVLKETSCAVMNSDGYWESRSCDVHLPYICKKPLNESQTEITNEWMATTCGTGWLPFSGYCYMMVKTPSTMEEANTDCQQKKAGLTSIHTLADVEFIITNNETKEDVWTGLKNENVPTLFHWSDNSSVSFTYWSRNEPNIPFNSTPNCVAYSGELGLWKVKECEEKLFYVCKRKGLVNETVHDAGCPADGDWKRHGNACYKVSSQEVTFEHGCDLTIMNRFEQVYVNSLIRKNIRDESKYIWTSLQNYNDTREFHWMLSDKINVPVTYTNWNQYEPAHQKGCVVMSAGRALGKWEVKDCKQFKAMSICKTYIGPHTEPIPAPEPDPNAPCPDGWQGQQHYCYKVFHHERLNRKRSWEEAERFCEALGAHLPSFSNNEEMQGLHYFLRDTISDNRYFWIGLNKRNPGSENTWEWSDNRPVSSVIFSQPFHEDDASDRDCAAFKTLRRQIRPFHIFTLPDSFHNSYFVSPFHCDANLEWICQIPKGHILKIPEWYNPGAHHESSIFVDGDEFWFVNDTKLTFDEANLYCASNGSELASPQTLVAVRRIHETLSSISGYDKQKWWVKNVDQFQPLGFFPGRFHPGLFLESCQVMSAKYMFSSFPYENCAQQLPFVCQRINTTSVEKEPSGHHRPGVPCSNSSFAFGEKCYTTIKARYLSFEKANEFCLTLGGTLPVISSQVEQDVITYLLGKAPRKIWIGLKMKLASSQWDWVDESPVIYRNFNPLLHGNPRVIYFHHWNPEMGDQCAYIINDQHSEVMGTWNFTHCTDSQYFAVCQAYSGIPVKPEVPPDVFTFADHTYKVIQGNLTWLEAREQCVQQQMELVSVSDAYQQSALTVTVGRFTEPLWIGLASEDDGVHYHWSDGSHTIYSRWSEEESSGGCVYLDTDGFWKATECGEELAGAICHIPKNETTETAEGERIKCPHKKNGPNWIPFRNSCYTFQLVSSRWADFDIGEVHRMCKKLDPNAYILNIRNETENDFVKEQLLPYKDLVNWVWLGLYYDRNDEKLKWYDGTYVQYSNWRSGRPTVNDSLFFAGINVEGSWDIIQDNSYKFFQQKSIVACKIEKGSKEEYSKSFSGYMKYGNTTYKVIQEKMNWFEAQRECQKSGSNLASVHDEYLHIYLRNLSKMDGFPLWIGLSNQDVDGSSFEWSDGTAFEYRPWEFTSSNSTGQCVFINTKGFWNQTSCLSVQQGAICYNVTPPTSKTELPVSGCPQGNGYSNWVQYKGHCYAFDITFYNYSVYSMEKAKEICQTLDSSSRLLTIQNMEENQFVSRYVKEHPSITGRVWLGIDLDSKDKPVSWIDGSSLRFSNWDNKTVQVNSKARCAVLVSSSGAWKNVSCQESRSRIVCKSPIRSERTAAVAITFLVVIFVLVVAVILFKLYRRNTVHISSMFATVRYKRNFDDVDSTSIITQTD
ncbi:lymphocyte antigen 75 isoform X1 [Amia ocellicauda]|uniref:lymphocyte antigen 75 isoform X1 n=1 Tax=Amia ocellicauda TaxID=2972642 RepID=UPI0034641455